jgi:hypothetical protein
MPARNDITGDTLITKAATPEFREGHERIFGNKPVQRGRFIQDPETGKLIPAHEYRQRDESKLIVHVDNWDAYESPSTGKVISNRKQRDRDLKESGCRQYEGRHVEVQEAERHKRYEKQKMWGGIRETMEKTYYEIEHGYRRPK